MVTMEEVKEPCTLHQESQWDLTGAVLVLPLRSRALQSQCKCIRHRHYPRIIATIDPNNSSLSCQCVFRESLMHGSLASFPIKALPERWPCVESMRTRGLPHAWIICSASCRCTLREPLLCSLCVLRNNVHQKYL